MDAVADFLTTLLTAPVVLSWMLLVIACGVLLALSFLVAYGVAGIHAHVAKSWHELLVTATRLRVSWIWGWSIACILLLAHLTALAYLDRVESWIAALPYLITATLTLGIAAWLRRTVRTKVVRMQKVVQGGQP